jgi:ATP-dependent protease ClpP protease subunit
LGHYAGQVDIGDALGLSQESEDSNLVEKECLIIFNKEVEGEQVRRLQETLMEMALKERRKPVFERKPITLFINSEGGNCVDGFALVETIGYVRNMGVEVHGVVQGCAFSMASAILQACKPRYIGPYSAMMVHQVRCDIPRDRLEENFNKLHTIKDINAMMATLYAQKNTAGKNDPKFWIKMMMNNDKYFLAHEAVKIGLADGVYDDSVMRARWAEKEEAAAEAEA